METSLLENWSLNLSLDNSIDFDPFLAKKLGFSRMETSLFENWLLNLNIDQG
jgi:hypothetical protein